MMAAAGEEAGVDAFVPAAEPRNFTVFSQKLEFSIDLCSQTVIGKTELQILPLEQDLRRVRLNARQCQILAVSVEDIQARFSHNDIYPRIRPHSSFKIRQYHLHRAKLAPALSNPPVKELEITFPSKVKVREAKPWAESVIAGKAGAGDVSAVAETPAGELGTTYNPIKIEVHFKVNAVRDGLQFVGIREGDARYPHVYTRNSQFPGSSCVVFPCIDDPQSRNTWEISIKCARTLGDAMRALSAARRDDSTPRTLANGADLRDENAEFSEEEQALEMTVVCSGETTDEILDPRDPSMKTVTFAVNSAVSANQIGFAIGPFECVELSDFREIDEDEKLGSNATSVQAFCLPGRADEVRNTAMPMAKAVDFFTTSFTTYPFESYQMCFLDDMRDEFVVTAGLSLCSTRMLFPSDIIDPLMDATRSLVSGLASQYSGICIAAKESADNWVISGISSFMTDIFMRQLSGNNEYRWNQKKASDRVCELDVERPSLHNLGSILDLDPSESSFLNLKAGVVLFILDRRLAKTGGSAGMTRIISRLLTNAKTSEAEATLVSTTQFQRLCEKMGHVKLDSFFNQWVYGAGCPIFEVRQSFNKKKLVVNIAIEQKQAKIPVEGRQLDPKDFLRDVKEEANEVWAGALQPVFTGPMTIRIHEADGTPYEHIVEIKDAITQLEIPYNTKYKRLKRSKRQKERATGNNNNAAVTGAGEPNDDVLLYCLGDVLQSKDEFDDWRLADWPEDIENSMGEESYEWIRMDADFEWICRLTINMPSYMFVSQLQQDRDVVAQLESLKFMESQPGNGLMATFLIRTVMDRRYFHGIREMATSLLPKTAKAELDWIGLYHLEKAFQELFCVPNSVMTRPNDFSDRSLYLLQCSIPRAISKVKDNSGHAPMRVKRFFVDKLKFNDNSDNEFSDCYYLANLLECMAETLTPTANAGLYRNLTIDEEEEELKFRDDAVNELERHRRIDEWIASYHNIFSLTALQCMTRLAKVKVLRPKLSDYLQYTRPGNADDLRTEAFRGLVELDMLHNDALLRYMVYTFSHDPSPFVRLRVFQTFGLGLGKIAIGDVMKVNKSQETDGLIIEQEASTEERATTIARRTTLVGALAALKAEMSTNLALQESLLDAMSSSLISLQEIPALLTLCEVLYDPEDQMVVRLRYPRYWRVQHLGKGKLQFSQTSKIRTTPRKPLQTAPTGVDTKAVQAGPKAGTKISLFPGNASRRSSIQIGTPITPAVHQGTKLKLGSRKPLMQTPVPQDHELKPATNGRSLVVKLRLSKAQLSRFAEIYPMSTSIATNAMSPPPKISLFGSAKSQHRSTSNTSVSTAATVNGHASDAQYAPYVGPQITAEPTAIGNGNSTSADLLHSGYTNGRSASAHSDDAPRSSKKRKSETPVSLSAEPSTKKRKSQTPQQSPPPISNEAPQFAPYIPPTSASSPPPPPAEPVRRQSVFKIKLNIAGNRGQGNSSSPGN